jgi:hypothetical protein
MVSSFGQDCTGWIRVSFPFPFLLSSAATTYDITKLLGTIARLAGTIKVISLLQPPPETVALFDELILISKGRIIYCGPVDDVVDYFEGYGYKIPERMDVADWLQNLPTPGGADYLVDQTARDTHLSTEDFKKKFDESPKALAIRERNETPLSDEYKTHDSIHLKARYHNTSLRSMRLLINRELLIWWRDKYQIKARVMQDIVMGVVSGTLFWQQSDDPQVSSLSSPPPPICFSPNLHAMLIIFSKVCHGHSLSVYVLHQHWCHVEDSWSVTACRSFVGFVFIVAILTILNMSRSIRTPRNLLQATRRQFLSYLGICVWAKCRCIPHIID